jgi:hypothetical protein
MGFLVILCILAYLMIGFSIGIILIRTGSVFCRSGGDLFLITAFWIIGLPVLGTLAFFAWAYDKIVDYPQ